MKAVRLHQYEQRPSVEDVPEPVIRTPSDVIVRVGGAGLCRTDLHIVEGQWAAKTNVPLPFTLGHENAGWVQAVGSGVQAVSVGDAVILHPYITCGHCPACRRGDDVHCEHAEFPGIDTDGGMADLVRTGERSLVKLQPGLEPSAVAALADAGLTAYHAARRAAGRLRPGNFVVVIGAGGLGHIGVQALLALTPAELIVVDRSAAALAQAKEFGARFTVLADDHAVEAVMDITRGFGAEAILDFVGEKGAVESGVRMLRRAGTYYVIGYGGRLDVPTIDVISTETSFVGSLVGSYTDLCELMTLATQGKVILTTRLYPLSEVDAAMDDLEAGRIAGRAILVP